MKTIYYILIALFITANLTSCTADSIADNEDVPVEENASQDDGKVNDEDTGGN